MSIENGADRAAIAAAFAATPHLPSAPSVESHVERDVPDGTGTPEPPVYGSAPVPSVVVQAQLLGQQLAREEAWNRTAAKIAHVAYDTIEPETPVQSAFGVYFLDRRKPVDVVI